MKTNKIFVYACLIIACSTATKITCAQQQVHSKLSVLEPIRKGQPVGNLTSRVFMASNKTYGYDILSNGRLIYHQPAFSRVPSDGDAVLTKKEQANLAAMVAIDKIKRGKNPELSNGELQKIIAHQ